MINTIRTNSDNPDFQSLIILLDKDLKENYGEEQSFFDQFNKVDKIQHVVLAYSGDKPVGCGAIKEYEKDVAEIKRMFVHDDFRGSGIAKRILNELEQWAKELNFSKCILETGNKQAAAIGLYKKSGYDIIPNFGQYVGVESSVCMKKEL